MTKGAALAAVALVVVVGAMSCSIPGDARVARTIPTGAGFSLSIAAPAAGVHLTAARLERSGLPAFTRHVRRTSQVVVGPYVSIDEAELAQRRLAARGLRGRLIVDESVRRVPGHDGVPETGAGANVLLVSGAGRLSVVVEMPAEPRQMLTRREDPDVLEVDAAPIAVALEPRLWNAPAGVDLFDHVSIEHVAAANAIRTRVSLSALARTNVRLVGRRLYIDIWSEVPGRPATEVAGRPFTSRQNDRRQAKEVAPVEAPDYRTVIAPAIARLETMEPFVLSSVATPSPDVLAALEGSLRGLEGWMQGVEAPGEWVQTHDSLIAAVRVAMNAVDPEFTGDRAARARAAFAVVAALKRATTYNLPPTSYRLPPTS